LRKPGLGVEIDVLALQSLSNHYHSTNLTMAAVTRGAHPLNSKPNLPAFMPELFGGLSGFRSGH
jgi:hypothetical protein